MKEIKAWQCDRCGKIHTTAELAQQCENEHIPVEVNVAFFDGKTLGEINESFKLWKTIPSDLIAVTKDTALALTGVYSGVGSDYKIMGFCNTRSNPQIRVRSSNGHSCLASVHELMASPSFF